MKPAPRLGGKVVVVTGGTRGLGKTIASVFAARGHVVWCVARNGPGKKLPAGCHFVPADVRQPAELAAAAKVIRRNSGRIDVWINNAGGGGRMPFSAADTPAWREIFDSNFWGTVHGCHVALHPRAARAGAIINIASIAGLMAPEAHSAYATAKAAVMALTRSLAVEYARAGVRVNAVAPGPMDTPGFRQADRSHRRARSIPVRRLISPAEIASACLWLSQPLNSLTGQTLVMDGGATAAGCYV